MSYEKKTWTTGETITADALNNIEEGIENAIGTLYLTGELVDTAYTLSASYNDIMGALNVGKMVAVIITRSDTNFVNNLVAYGHDSVYYVGFYDSENQQIAYFEANDADTHLVLQNQ